MYVPFTYGYYPPHPHGKADSFLPQIYDTIVLTHSTHTYQIHNLLADFLVSVWGAWCGAKKRSTVRYHFCV